MLRVRPIRPTDDDAYRTILARLSAEDRYARFLHAVSEIGAEEIRRFTTPADDFIGVIALDGDRPVGVAHAWLEPGGTAEFAVVVAAGERQHGVGHALLARIIEEVTARGCRRLVAYALADNAGMTHLAHDFGMRLRGIDENVATWSLDLRAGLAA